MITQDRHAAWHGIFYQEWLRHRATLGRLLGAWFIGSLALVLFFHPAWLLGFGLIYALIMGPLIGGADTSEGTQEFSLSLPPTRADRYLVRLALGMLPLLLMTSAGCLMIAWGLPQKIWRLFVESGFTEPFPSDGQGIWYPLAILVPFAAFSTAFAAATFLPTRTSVSLSGFLGVAWGIALVFIGSLIEHWLWDEFHGRLTCLGLSLVGTAELVGGYCAYSRKEGAGASRSAGGLMILVWLAVAAIVLALLAGLAVAQVSNSVVPSVSPEESE